MEDPQLIVTMIPTDEQKLAENAFRLKHNSDYYLAPTRRIKEGRIFSSRESTPADGEPVDDHCKYDLTHRITLSLKRMPKDPTKGFCFGSNPQTCDVLLGHREEGISNVHFCITFNHKKKLILKDSSTHGTAVSYNGQAKQEIRHHFTWILQLEKENGGWEIEVRVRRHCFKVEFARHQSCAAEYTKNVGKFVMGLNDLTINGLGIFTPTALPSLSLTPGRSPIYISERELGRGSFGVVDKVTDASTGEIYARKTFLEPQWREYENLIEKKNVWLSRVRREIRIMKDSQHENIVKVVDAQYEPSPFLVMEYLRFGNLGDLNNVRDYCEKEAVGLFYQALDALEYLHARGVAHRDLKPANILVESQTPLLIKLADFGFANDNFDLKTQCGTRIYQAPEIHLGAKHTTLVDLWSLGVVILEYAYGLPSTRLEIIQKKDEAWGLAWCRRIIDYANDWELDALLDFLTAGLLRMTPAERLSADACLRKGRSIGLFDGRSPDSGTVTPKPGSALQAGISDREGSATIIPGALWGKEDVNSNQDGESETGRFLTLQHTSRARDSHIKRARHSHSSQLGGFETSSAPTDNNDQSLADLLCPIDTISRGSKRLRSPAIGPTNSASSQGRVKRRPKEDFLTENLVGRTDEIPNRQYSASPRAVLALLVDLWLGDTENLKMDIGDHTKILIGELCEYLTQLEITKMRLAQNNHSGQAILAIGSDGREIMLANLNSFKLMSSVHDLVIHLLQIVKLESFPISGTPIAHKGQSQTDAVAYGRRSQSRSVDPIGSSETISSASDQGLTYPSALLEEYNVSGCSIPTFKKRSADVK